MFAIEVSLSRFTEWPLLHDVVAFPAEREYFIYDVADFIRRLFDRAVGLMDLSFARSLRGSGTQW